VTPDLGYGATGVVTHDLMGEVMSDLMCEAMCEVMCDAWATLMGNLYSGVQRSRVRTDANGLAPCSCLREPRQTWDGGREIGTVAMTFSSDGDGAYQGWLRQAKGSPGSVMTMTAAAGKSQKRVSRLYRLTLSTLASVMRTPEKHVRHQSAERCGSLSRGGVRQICFDLAAKTLSAGARCGKTVQRVSAQATQTCWTELTIDARASAGFSCVVAFSVQMPLA